MPVSKFSEANRDECLEHLLEAGNQLASVLRVLRHSRFESEKPQEVFAEAIAVPGEHKHLEKHNRFN